MSHQHTATMYFSPAALETGKQKQLSNIHTQVLSVSTTYTIPHC